MNKFGEIGKLIHQIRLTLATSNFCCLRYTRVCVCVCVCAWYKRLPFSCSILNYLYHSAWADLRLVTALQISCCLVYKWL